MKEYEGKEGQEGKKRETASANSDRSRATLSRRVLTSALELQKEGRKEGGREGRKEG
jgi:hypothetical protein